jgi:hypothetical protein
MRSPLSCLVLAVLVACTDGTRDAAPAAADAPVIVGSTPASEPTPPEPPTLVLSPPRRVQASGMIIESAAGGGPRFCMSWEESLPPQCGGIPLANFAWAKVEGEETSNGVTFGDYHVVGDFDGKALALAQPPGARQRPAPRARRTPCEQPAGGWERPNRELMGLDQVYVLAEAARALPGFAGLWMNDLEPQTGEVQDMRKVIVNVAFSGDAASHTAELRKHWGGALCVVQRTRTNDALERIKSEAMEFASGLGLETSSSDHDETAGLVRVEVVYADETHQAKMDEEYGAGVVVLESRLRPVPAVLPRAGEACTDGESLADGCACDRRCMDICCVGSACSHSEFGYSKCISMPKKRKK